MFTPLRRTASVFTLLLLAVTGCAGHARRVPTADPTAHAASSNFDAAVVVETATSMLGAPYRHGGSSPTGFDCSGLVVYSYARAGIDGLPRTARDLMNLTEHVQTGDLEPGDLLFFDVGRGRVSHVGIFVAERTFVHAPSSGKSVAMASLDHAYWKRHLHRAGRLGR